MTCSSQLTVYFRFICTLKQRRCLSCWGTLTSKGALKAPLPAWAQVQRRHSFWHGPHGNHLSGGSRQTLRVNKIHSKYICNFFSPGRVTVKLDAFKTPIRFYISQIYIIYSLQQVHAYFQWLVVQISVYSVYEFIPPSCLEWHFFLCIFTLFFLDQAFVAWLFWMVLKSSPCERCLFPITRHLTDSDLNFNEALARSRVSVPLVRQPSPECAQSTTVTLLLGYASIFPPIHLYRSSLANVSTTHVERAAIVVALVTTSKPGWQGPSTLGISVRVRKMYTNADYTLQLQQWLVQLLHYNVLNTHMKLEFNGNESESHY